jgi:acyl-CoA thioester hydrolase
MEQSAALASFHFVTTAVVNWADQDPLQHVNHKVFLGWMESNRVAYFERIGLWSDNPTGGVGIILAAICCNYRMPLSYPDRVHIGIAVTKIGTRSIGMRQVVFSEKAYGIAADSESTVVVYDYGQGQSCAIPEVVREALKANRFAQE